LTSWQPFGCRLLPADDEACGRCGKPALGFSTRRWTSALLVHGLTSVHAGPAW